MAFLLLQFIMLFMLFSGTYLFQVGLISVLVREFRISLYTMFSYSFVFIIYASVKFHYFERVVGLNDGLWANQGYAFLSGLQKVASLPYYLSILQTCGRLGEIEWYWRGPWVARYVQTRSGAGGV
jgi:hypothetical protein